jgi:hypothetical protein
VSVDFDRLLRDTVHELAAQGRPVDLTAAALRTARRIRTRRIVSAVASVLMVLVGVGVAVIRVGGTDRSLPPAGLSPAPSVSASAVATPSPAPTESLPPGSAPFSLPGGWLVRAAAAALGAIVFDDQLGRYRLAKVNGARVSPSPNGQFVAFVESNTQDVVVRRVADDSEVARRNESFTDASAYPVWSPDSSRVAYVTDSAQGDRLVIVAVDGTEVRSDGSVPCSGGCTVKWLESGRGLRVYGGSSRAEVTVATGAVGAPSATPDDPCGYRFAGYHIDGQSWLCVTVAGFAVTATGGAVTNLVPLPTSIEGLTVGTALHGWVLFRPK